MSNPNPTPPVRTPDTIEMLRARAKKRNETIKHLREQVKKRNETIKQLRQENARLRWHDRLAEEMQKAPATIELHEKLDAERKAMANQRKVLEEVQRKYEDELLVTRALSASNTELEYQRKVLINALKVLGI